MLLLKLGCCYWQEGLRCAHSKKITLAVAALEKAVMLQEDKWEAYNLLGLCCYRLGTFDRCREVWERSLTLSPQDNPAAYYLEELNSPAQAYRMQRFNEALALAQRGRYRQAEKRLREKDVCCFSFVTFTNLLGLCLYGRHKKKLALWTWLQALTLDRENPWTLKYLQQGFSQFSSRA